jgi:hypothetical protein
MSALLTADINVHKFQVVHVQLQSVTCNVRLALS